MRLVFSLTDGETVAEAALWTSAYLAHYTDGPRLLVDLGLSPTTWRVINPAFVTHTGTLGNLYAALAKASEQGVKLSLDVLTALIGNLWEPSVYRSLDDLAERHEMPTLLPDPDIVSNTTAFKKYSPHIASLFHVLEQNKSVSITAYLGTLLPGLVLQDTWCARATKIYVVLPATALHSLGWLPLLFTYKDAHLHLLLTGKRADRVALLPSLEAILRLHGVQATVVELDLPTQWLTPTQQAKGKVAPIYSTLANMGKDMP